MKWVLDFRSMVTCELLSVCVLVGISHGYKVLQPLYSCT
jgi:hypothetical protein